MPTDPVIEFAQRRFGTDAGLPTDATARAPIPDWLAGAGDEDTIPVEVDDPIRVEGPVPRGPTPAANGTTVETLAFYVPFHFYRTKWGIYIRAGGVWSLARRLALPKKLPDLNILRAAYHLLLEHERFHFCAEYAASRIEVVTPQACYSSYFKDKDASLHEEAVANAHALRALTRRASAKLVKTASAWMTAQPQGYRDFKNWLPPRLTDGKRQAALFMTPSGLTNRILAYKLTRSSGYAFHPADFLFLQTTDRRIPIRIVLESSTPWLKLARPFPKDFGLQVYVHSNDHRPYHIHIDCPPGTPCTRYLWPERSPYPGDPSLSTGEEKRLRKYLKVHGRAIARRVATVPWK